MLKKKKKQEYTMSLLNQYIIKQPNKKISPTKHSANNFNFFSLKF